MGGQNLRYLHCILFIQNVSFAFVKHWTQLPLFCRARFYSLPQRLHGKGQLISSSLDWMVYRGRNVPYPATEFLTRVIETAELNFSHLNEELETLWIWALCTIGRMGHNCHGKIFRIVFCIFWEERIPARMICEWERNRKGNEDIAKRIW